MATSACAGLITGAKATFVYHVASPNACSATHFLPAWRWGFAPGDFSQKLGSVIPNIIAYLTIELATIMFWLSDICWMIITTLASISATVTAYIFQLGKLVNTAVSAVGKPLQTSMIPLIILIALALAFIIAIVVGRDHRKHLKNLAVAFAALAVLFMLVASSTAGSTKATLAAKPTTVAHPTPSVNQPGSAAWLLHTATTLIHPLGDLLTKVQINNSVPTTTQVPNCNQYIVTLNTLAQKSNVGANVSANASAIETSVSNLWLSAEYNLFADAQFGIGNKPGERATCHWMEVASGQSNVEQQAIMYTSYVPSTKENFPTADLLDFGPAVMNGPSTTVNVADTERLLDAWGICVNPGKGGAHFGWVGTATFNAVRINGKEPTWGYYCSTFWNATSNFGASSNSGANTAQTSGEPTNPVSSNFGNVQTGTTKFTAPYSGPKGKSKNTPLIPSSTHAVSFASPNSCTGSNMQCGSTDPFYYNYSGAVTSATAKTSTLRTAAIKSAKSAPSATEAIGNGGTAAQFLLSVNGHIGLGGALSGVIALLTSVAYLLAIGGLLLGLAIGTVGVVLWLILLPVWLILWAVPQSREIAKRATRLGMSLLLLQVFFSFVISILLLLMNVITGIILGLHMPDGSFLALLAPIIALAVLRFGSKKLGVGKLTGMRGAANMSLGAMKMSAAGRRDASALTGGKLGQGLDKLDSRMPLSRKRIDKKRTELRQKRRSGWQLARRAREGGAGRKGQLTAAKKSLPWYARLAVRSGAADRVWGLRNNAKGLWKNKGEMAGRPLRAVGRGAGAVGSAALVAGRGARRKALGSVGVGAKHKHPSNHSVRRKIAQPFNWSGRTATSLARRFDQRFLQEGHGKNALNSTVREKKASEITFTAPATLAPGVSRSEAEAMAARKGVYFAPPDGSHTVRVMSDSKVLASTYNPELAAALARQENIQPNPQQLFGAGDSSVLTLNLRRIEEAIREGNRQRGTEASATRDHRRETTARQDQQENRPVENRPSHWTT